MRRIRRASVAVVSARRSPMISFQPDGKTSSKYVGGPRRVGAVPLVMPHDSGSLRGGSGGVAGVAKAFPYRMSTLGMMDVAGPD